MKNICTKEKIFTRKKILRFQKIIVGYFNLKGRNFSWRKTNDPWKILMSEILLRKTTAKQAYLIYEKISTMTPGQFIKIDIKKLSKKLEYLGMQNERAKLFKKIAQMVKDNGEKELENEDFLESLPGVGPYSRNAVLCFAYSKPLPTLDRNMIRILERVFSIVSKKSRPHTDKELWEIASDLVPVDSCKEYNWGVIDISAEFCRPKKPKCNYCPLNKICDYAEMVSI
jgi:A/G-specific adenine glycosylase